MRARYGRAYACDASFVVPFVIRRAPGAGACLASSTLVVAKAGPIGPKAVPFRRPSMAATASGSGVVAVPTPVGPSAVAPAMAPEKVHAAVARLHVATPHGRRQEGTGRAAVALHPGEYRFE